jgi:hypothetical protein
MGGETIVGEMLKREFCCIASLAIVNKEMMEGIGHQALRITAASAAVSSIKGTVA